jgi:pimeloyl-ACP methyl ester carboxylesterase
MSDGAPIVLIPGLACSPRLYAGQLAPLWRFGPVTVADHTRDESMAAIAGRILASAPPRFALAGLSMGGYISMEIMRQAPERVLRLALLDTTARPDAPEQSDRRRAQIALAKDGGFGEVVDQLYGLLVHPMRLQDQALRRIVDQMADEVGASAFVRQQQAILGRIDSRPGLSLIACPTLVLVGDGDALTPPDRAEEMAGAIPGARLVVVPRCGHLSTLERADAVTVAMEAWLAG